MATTAEYQKAYYWANRECMLAIAKKSGAKYTAANKEKEAERKRLYKRNNKEKIALLSAKRRALKLNNNHEKYTLEEVLNKWGTDCHLCQTPIDLMAPRRVGRKGWENGLHLDHLVSLSNGGSDNLDNIRPAHGACNIKKGNKDLLGDN
jgi:5-methylcytosine-specific restriction endonuclease McrA